MYHAPEILFAWECTHKDWCFFLHCWADKTEKPELCEIDKKQGMNQTHLLHIEPQHWAFWCEVNRQRNLGPNEIPACITFGIACESWSESEHMLCIYVCKCIQVSCWEKKL